MPSRAEQIEEKDKEDHARLPAQMPASRVARNPGGQRVGETARQSRKESTRLQEKTTLRSQVT